MYIVCMIVRVSGMIIIINVCTLMCSLHKLLYFFNTFCFVISKVTFKINKKIRVFIKKCYQGSSHYSVVMAAKGDTTL